MKKLQTRHYVYAALVLLIVGSYGATAALWRHQRKEITSLNNQITTLVRNQAANAKGYTAATIAPTDKAVYLPLANLKLPMSTLAEGLVYTYTDDYHVPGIKKLFPATLGISTHDLAANSMSTTQQFDCSEVGYADFVTPSYPVNPMYKLAGKTKLAGGRTMNVYYSPSVPGCQTAWKLNNIDSKAIADLLLQATSY